MAQGGDGNTKPPPCARNEYKHWIITIKADHVSNGSLLPWIKEHCHKAVWQCEEGTKDNKYQHWQLSISLKKRQRMTWLKNHFNKTAHYEAIKNIDSAFNYCQKNETRILGPFYYPEQINEIDDPMEGVTLHNWQLEILEIIKQKPHPRHVYWYWEPIGGAGKTSFCKHLILKHDCKYFRNGKKSDIFHAVDSNPKTILIDISRSCEDINHLYDVVECLKDGMIFSGKYQSTTKVFNCPHVIIFSNDTPNESKLSRDRWIIKKIENFTS